MIDTHAHIDSDRYAHDRALVLRRAYDAGVEKIINVGADLAGSAQSVRLAAENGNVFAAVGLHPHVFNGQGAMDGGQERELRELAKNGKVVAIGEIGLDYYFPETRDPELGAREKEEMKKNQKEGFIKQLEIARELDLPAIIHCRASKEDPADAYEDTYAIISDAGHRAGGVRSVFHCYGGSLEFTEKLLREGNISFSFTGNITYAKEGSETLAVLKAIPLERMMLETDCPYLTPVPHRGKRNEPSFVAYVRDKVAEIKGITAEKADLATSENARKFFRLD